MKIPVSVPARSSALAPILAIAMLLSLAACQQVPTAANPDPAGSAHADITQVPKTAASIKTIDDYKMLVAQQILDANRAITFSGRLPPMLPAIVVVNITVDRDGDVRNVTIKRSRDEEGSRVALAAVYKAGPVLPKPMHLLKRGDKTLEFSETFLFDERFHFQLRSLAGPQ